MKIFFFVIFCISSQLSNIYNIKIFEKKKNYINNYEIGNIKRNYNFVNYTNTNNMLYDTKKNKIKLYNQNKVNENKSSGYEKLTNIVLVIDYDGTHYNGWTGIENCSPVYLNAVNGFKNVKNSDICKDTALEQIEDSDTSCNSLKKNNENKYNTVQNCILNCLLKIHGYGDNPNIIIDKKETDFKPFEFIGVSRTDKGVHAKEYVCQYISYKKRPPFNGNLEKIKLSLNRLLNKDIKVLGIFNAPFNSFNVRFHNLGKIYTYNIDLRKPSQPLEKNFAWQLYDDSRFSFLLKNKLTKYETCVKGNKKNSNKNLYDTNLTSLFDENHNNMDKDNCDSFATCSSSNEDENISEPSKSSDTVEEEQHNFEHAERNANDLIIKERIEDIIKKEKEKNGPDKIIHSLNIINGKNEFKSSILCDIDKIKECSKLFIGYHNFECFRGTLKGTEKQRTINTFCNIHFLDIYKLKDNLYQFVIQGDRFLYHMIRIIVGVLIQVGVGILNIQDVKDALYNCKPLRVKLCAPAQGLCLKKILFPAEIESLVNSAIFPE
ncbi:tRNA pseudouridine synthase, putative [Plasmodium vinckei]|uniref:tRNA pseudouridine synthase, putative n=1 Tax=Plasmodium vinckei TaxID=5860 RepID=A0A6V7TAG2_PLAVN|nr:tRNA pseudouridine synthase, putative [Plasmodium vinckei]